MCQLCASVLQGKMYWESKSVRGMGSHASIFLNSRDPLEYSCPPICSPIQADVWAGIARKTHHTIIYWECNIGGKSNELLPEGCLWNSGSLRHMKEKYCVFTLYTSVYSFPPFSRCLLWCRGSSLTERNGDVQLRQFFHLFFHLLSATSSSFQERNINWAWLHLSELLYVSC